MQTFLIMLRNGKRILCKAEVCEILPDVTGKAVAIRFENLDIDNRYPLYIDPNEVIAVEVLKVYDKVKYDEE